MNDERGKSASDVMVVDMHSVSTNFRPPAMDPVLLLEREKKVLRCCVCVVCCVLVVVLLWDMGRGII